MGERQAPEHGLAGRQTHTGQTWGERKEKATALPELSGTALQLFRRVVQTTQELLRVQLREEPVCAPQDHQTGSVSMSMIPHRSFLPMASKAGLPSALWAVLPGLASIPGTLGTKRLINRGREKKKKKCFIVQKPK